MKKYIIVILVMLYLGFIVFYDDYRRQKGSSVKMTGENPGVNVMIRGESFTYVTVEENPTTGDITIKVNPQYKWDVMKIADDTMILRRLPKINRPIGGRTAL